MNIATTDDPNCPITGYLPYDAALGSNPSYCSTSANTIACRQFQQPTSTSGSFVWTMGVSAAGGKQETYSFTFVICSDDPSSIT